MSTLNKQMLIRKIERRMRAKYLRRCVLWFLIALIIGLLAGIGLCKWGPLQSFVDSSHASTGGNVPLEAATPAPEETAEAEPEATPVSVVEVTAAPEETPAPEAESTPAAEATETAAPETTAEETAPAETETAAVTPEADEGDTETVAETAETVVTAAATDAENADSEAEVASTEAGAPEEPEEPAVVVGTPENPVPFGETYSFETEIVKGGTPRYSVSTSEYETLGMTASVLDYLTPEYFAEKYSTKYKLQGNEAGAALQLKLDSATESQSLNPQDAIMICFEGEDGTVSPGYQLMNAEIAGDYGVPLEVGEEKTYYKRFAYTTDPAMKYLALTYYVGGQANKVYFALEPEPEPEETPAPEANEGDANATAAPAVTYTTVELGSRGDNVKALQERLVALGYLANEEGAADGIAGAKTETAIKAAQKKAGMSETGVADQAFQEYIFSDEAASAN